MKNLIKNLKKQKNNLHFLMKNNIWHIGTGTIKSNFAEILKENFDIDCNNPDALEKIINYGNQTKKVNNITYGEMYNQAKLFYEENKYNYNYIGIRFENKQRLVGEICENSKGNIDREDVREYPAYGTKEYNELPELNGTCAYDLSDNRAYDSVEKKADKPALSQVTADHCYIIVGDELSGDFAEDDAEIIIKSAKVVKKIF